MMDIPDDLSGLTNPVPHYRDIRAADTARTLPSPIGGILITLTIMGVATWVPWWCHQLGVWFGSATMNP